MKPFACLICVVLFFACKEKHDKTTGAAIKPLAGSIQAAEDSGQIVFIERVAYNLDHYSIVIKTKFVFPGKFVKLEQDSSFYLQGQFLFVFNKAAGKRDTLLITQDGVSLYDLEIKDVSDSLHFKTLALDISWTGDSDTPNDVFVECGKDSLSLLFSTINLVSLQRKDKQTFTGFMTSRDNLVYSFEHDYPFTVSLKDHEVHMQTPDIQYIGYPTTALAAIKGYRVTGQDDSTAYTIKKRTKLVVDTLYRSADRVRLIVSDTIVVVTKAGNAGEKLGHNNAG